MLMIQSRESFDNLTGWLEEIWRYSARNTPIMLIGNKCDLEHWCVDALCAVET
jgi:GTPase SAR1 family protein